MKQHITIKQLSKLSEKAKIKYRNWFYASNDYPFGKSRHPFRYEDTQGTVFSDYINDGFEGKCPLMSIGQMIEFLDEHESSVFDIQMKNEVIGQFWSVLYGERLIQEDELCDTLWEACREILDNLSK